MNVIGKYEATKDGFTIMRSVDGDLKFYTFYNDSAPPSRIRFTIAHEIKHVIFLETNPNEKQEDLANHFARYILAPSCLIMPYIGKYPGDIVSDFDISYDVADFALKAAINRKMSRHEKLTTHENEFIEHFTNN